MGRNPKHTTRVAEEDAGRKHASKRSRLDIEKEHEEDSRGERERDEVFLSSSSSPSLHLPPRDHREDYPKKEKEVEKVVFREREKKNKDGDDKKEEIATRSSLLEGINSSFSHSNKSHQHLPPSPVEHQKDNAKQQKKHNQEEEEDHHYHNSDNRSEPHAVDAFYADSGESSTSEEAEEEEREEEEEEEKESEEGGGMRGDEGKASRDRRQKLLFLPDNTGFTFDFTHTTNTGDGEEEIEEEDGGEGENHHPSYFSTAAAPPPGDGSPGVVGSSTSSSSTLDTKKRNEKEKNGNASSSSPSFSVLLRRHAAAAHSSSSLTAEEVASSRETALSLGMKKYLTIPVPTVTPSHRMMLRKGTISPHPNPTASTSSAIPPSNPHYSHHWDRMVPSLSSFSFTSRGGNSSFPFPPVGPPSHLSANAQKKWWRRWKRMEQERKAQEKEGGENGGGGLRLEEAIPCFQRSLKEYEENLWREGKEKEKKKKKNGE